MIKTGISGLRGTVGDGEENLTVATVARWVQAYAAEISSRAGIARLRIALGRDARRSSPALAAVARGALLLAGAEVVELGVTLTPTVQHYVRRAQLDGGVMITASHNPIQYNGLKFLDGNGFFLAQEVWAAMEERVTRNDLPQVPLERAGTLTDRGDAAWQAHLAAAIRAVDLDEVRSLRLRVALDACNGAAVRWVDFLDACGCETILLHGEQHGYFSREAEPLPQHLTALCEMVRHARCDIGFAADPDGDRLVLVDAHGNPVSEELTVVLVAMSLFAPGTRGALVVNSVTTHAIEAVPGAVIVRTAVGEMNVVAGILEHDALMGGEGSGGIIVPRINMARDGLAAIAMLLRLLARTRRPLDELIAEIPKWQSIKSKVTSQSSPDLLRTLFNRWIEEPPTVHVSDELLVVESSSGLLRLALTPESVFLRAEIRQGEVFTAEGRAPGLAPLFSALAERNTVLDLTDGVKVTAEGAWISLRTSNTEPVVRIMGEIRQ